MAGARFWKKKSPARAVREALERHRSVLHPAHRSVGDRQVVSDESSLVTPTSAKKALSGFETDTVCPSTSRVTAWLGAIVGSG